MPTLAPVPVEVYLRTGDYEPRRGVRGWSHRGTSPKPVRSRDLAAGASAVVCAKSSPVEHPCPSRASGAHQPDPIRIPDVTVFDRNRPVEQILTHPPVAVFEVLSPEDRIHRMLRKLAAYEAMGIRNIFVIDPEEDVYSRYVDGRLLLLSGDVEPLTGWTGFIDWSAVKALQD